jgi:hypothetical protein
VHLLSTPDVGAAFAPAGSSFAGWGVPATANAPGGVVFRDPYTGVSLTGRRIDPVTKQFVIDANGRALGMTTAQQGMYLALRTVRNSSAARGLGQTFSNIRDIGPDYTRRVTDAVNIACADLVSKKIVQIISVTVLTPQLGPNSEFLTVAWLDLTTKQERTTSV